MRKVTFLVLAFALGLLLVNSSQALLLHVSDEHLVDNSACIAVGKVVDKVSDWEGEIIVTFATIEVEQFLKADTEAERIVVAYHGGTIGDLSLTVPDSPEFEVGERVIVFGQQDENGRYILYAWRNGKFTVEDGTVVERGISEEAFINHFKEIIAVK